ncbi:hypothetical protein PG995_015946 [Apiospora arundinis]
MSGREQVIEVLVLLAAWILGCKSVDKGVVVKAYGRVDIGAAELHAELFAGSLGSGFGGCDSEAMAQAYNFGPIEYMS